MDWKKTVEASVILAFYKHSAPSVAGQSVAGASLGGGGRSLCATSESDPLSHPPYTLHQTIGHHQERNFSVIHMLEMYQIEFATLLMNRYLKSIAGEPTVRESAPHSNILIM